MPKFNRFRISLNFQKWAISQDSSFLFFSDKLVIDNSVSTELSEPFILVFPFKCITSRKYIVTETNDTIPTIATIDIIATI